MPLKNQGKGSRAGGKIVGFEKGAGLEKGVISHWGFLSGV